MSYEALSLRRRYLWDAVQRKGYEGSFWPGCYDRRPFKALAKRWRPKAHATQEWLAGQRYTRSDHWRIRALVASIRTPDDRP